MNCVSPQEAFTGFADGNGELSLQGQIRFTHATACHIHGGVRDANAETDNSLTLDDALLILGYSEAFSVK